VVEKNCARFDIFNCAAAQLSGNIAEDP